MMKNKAKALALIPALALGGLALSAAPAFAAPAFAADSGSWSYQAKLAELNGSGGSGDITVSLSGDQATVTEHVSGLAETFNNAPYPHVQHIHIGGQGTCPDPSADKNGDGIVDTVEGLPSYGNIGTTLSTSGDTSKAAGTDLKVAGMGGSFTYSRTFTMDADTISAIKNGTAVVVVHGLDPSKLSAKAQGEKSNLVPSLPLAATAPALCGTLAASQMAMPAGGAQTGAGTTSTGPDLALLALGGGIMLAGGGAWLVTRRVTARR